jgi:mono/diheme cytochrome c family protein
MPRRKQLYMLFCAVILAAGFAAAQNTNSQRGVINFVTPILPDPLLQHSKETYVLYGCAYCHGVDLVVRNGEAADLMHASLVGKDENGDLIGPLLRAGIPQTPKLSPMPQFADLSDQQIADIVRWIHYARQQGRYRELIEAKNPGPGNATAGKEYFDKACSSCHSAQGDMAKIDMKYDATALKAQILHPTFLDTHQSWKVDQMHDTRAAIARQRHFALLENYSAEDVANLMAYLLATK